MTALKGLEVTIAADTAQFMAALKGAAIQAARLTAAWNALPAGRRGLLAFLADPEPRHRTRVVTRNKQRRNW